MRTVQKLGVALLILASVLVAGCTSLDSINNNQVSVADTSSTEMTESDDDAIQYIQIMQDQPIQVMRDYTLYNEWNNRTREILEDLNGTKVKLYSYNMQFSGTVSHVGRFYVTLEDDIAGTSYVDINSINAVIPFPE